VKKNELKTGSWRVESKKKLSAKGEDTSKALKSCQNQLEKKEACENLGKSSEYGYHKTAVPKKRTRAIRRKKRTWQGALKPATQVTERVQGNGY